MYTTPVGLGPPTEAAVNRCVRRCFLCRDDPVSGRNYAHRKTWLEDRLKFLAGQFGIDVLGFAILSNRARRQAAFPGEATHG